jgi:murein hydrolase activator
MVNRKLEQLVEHLVAIITQRRRIIAVHGAVPAALLARCRRRACAFALGLVTGVALIAPVTVAQEEQAELARVRGAIEALQEKIARQQSDVDKGVRELRAVELEIAATQTTLTDLRDRRAEQQKILDARNAEARVVAGRLEDERGALGRQVRLSYMLGREELLKLVLNQESPTTLGRMVVYYDYLNKARSERIGHVSDELESLESLVAAARAAEAELGRLTAASEQQLATLESSRRRRADVIRELESSVETSGRELESLRADEKRLADLVNELDDILREFPVNAAEPFADLKGRLTWPVGGRIVEDYGQTRNGGPLRWNGVVLEAERGAPVRAIYYGRVAFSDWLPGLGLLLIVDHGNRYLSLYGYNEVLLKESGDWVEPGEVLAQVGDSSGRARTGLYFELRYRGEPVDPHAWMSGP